MATTQSGVVRFAPISLTATGTIIAAVANKTIVVLSYAGTLQATAACTAAFRSGASTLLTGTMAGSPAAANTPAVIGHRGTREVPLFACAKGESLDVVLTGASVSIQGFLSYILE